MNQYLILSLINFTKLLQIINTQYVYNTYYHYKNPNVIYVEKIYKQIP